MFFLCDFVGVFLIEVIFPLFCRSENNGGSKIWHSCNLTLMQGFKYNGNDLFEKIVNNKCVIMIDGKKEGVYCRFRAVYPRAFIVASTTSTHP